MAAIGGDRVDPFGGVQAPDASPTYAHRRSRQLLLAQAERARAGVVGFQLGPVALLEAVHQAQADACRLTGRDAPAAAPRPGELIACADAVHLRAILRHLMLAVASAAPDASLARVEVEACCGEARLVLHALAGVCADELAAVEELLGAMGGRLRLGAGPAPSAQLVLRGLPCAAQLRAAA